jgi:hypothetical protein
MQQTCHYLQQPLSAQEDQSVSSSQLQSEVCQINLVQIVHVKSNINIITPQPNIWTDNELTFFMHP